jgi:uncharacterized small protein (DUF1192 family)
MTTQAMQEKIRQMEAELKRLQAELDKMNAGQFDQNDAAAYLTEAYNG